MKKLVKARRRKVEQPQPPRKVILVLNRPETGQEEDAFERQCPYDVTFERIDATDASEIFFRYRHQVEGELIEGILVDKFPPIDVRQVVAASKWKDPIDLPVLYVEAGDIRRVKHYVSPASEMAFPAASAHVATA